MIRIKLGLKALSGLAVLQMKRKGLHVAASVGIAALLCGASPASAQTAPSLGSAQSFAVLAGTSVSNLIGASTITGDLGVSPGSTVAGFPPGVVASGTTYAGGATAAAAQTSLTTAYNDLVSQACTQDLSGQDLGGKTLTAGVYCFSSTAQLTGTLTLNAQGNAAAVFIFKIGSTLTTATSSSVVMINGGSTCNVFWQVGSSATVGSTSSFAGNILALTSITLNSTANVQGRALARNGEVRLHDNTVNLACVVTACATITLAPATLPGGTVAVAYSHTHTASGGAAPHSFGVTAGTLPAPLTLTSAGVLSGTPTAAGTSAFTVRATDTAGCFGEMSYTVVIAEAVPTLPQAFVVLLALGLTGIGYFRLRRRARSG